MVPTPTSATSSLSTPSLAPEALTYHLYSHFDEGAANHLFAVAAGLDSAVLGETEILGQVRDAWEAAKGHGTAARRSNALFRHSLEVGKRVRSETGLSRHTTSVSMAAVAMAGDALGGLVDRRVLVLGAGDIGEGMAIALARCGRCPRCSSRTARSTAPTKSRRGSGAVLCGCSSSPTRSVRSTCC